MPVSERKREHETVREKNTLYLCMGSACHQRGVGEVLPRVQALLELHNLTHRVELKGAFCLGQCGQGIAMRYGDTGFTNIRPSNVDEKFEEEVLPVIQVAEAVGEAEEAA